MYHLAEIAQVFNYINRLHHWKPAQLELYIFYTAF